MASYSLLGLLIFLLLSSASASPSTKDHKKSPLSHVNLSPFQGWRSAYECIIDEPNPCSAKEKLTMKGAVFVTKEETSEYCKKGGCGEHVQNVLQCIHQVKRDFWFANKASVQVLQDAISTGCRTFTEINTADYKKSAANKYQSFPKLLMLALPTVLLFMLIFHM